MNRPEKYKINKSQPLSEIYPNGSVVIVHPGCDATLFTFPAFPHPDLANAANMIYGMPSCLVLDACRILTNYAAKDGQDFFTCDRAGKEPVQIHVDRIDVLRSGCYYYFLGPSSTAAHVNYPIVKTFAALTFPHDMPRHWSRAATSVSSTKSPLVMAREPGLKVQVNDSPWGLDIGAFIPPSEVDWFNANEMHRYRSASVGADAGPANDPGNWIALRSDVRDIFYAHGFVFYPTGDGAHVDFFLDTAYLDYAAEYHRQRVNLHAEVVDQFIYAGFAYAMVGLPRCTEMFEGVPVSDAVKRARERRELEENIKAQLYEVFRRHLGPGMFAVYRSFGEDRGDTGTGPEKAARDVYSTLGG